MYFLALPTSFFILLRLSSNPVGYDLASDPDVATWRLNCAFTHVLFVFDSVLVYCFVSKQIICNIYKCDLKLYCQLLCSSWLFQEPWVRGGQDGGGIGRGDHFLSYKFIERTERWTKFTKQVLIAGNGHQAPRKAAHCLRREVGQNIKYKKGDKRARDGDPSREGSLNRGSFQSPGNPRAGGTGGSFQISEGNLTGRRN